MTERPLSPIVYVIGLVLVLFTIWTVGVSFVHGSGLTRVVSGLAIGAVKASLVVLFFMHAFQSLTQTRAVIAVTILWLVVVLLTLTFSQTISPVDRSRPCGDTRSSHGPSARTESPPYGLGMTAPALGSVGLLLFFLPILQIPLSLIGLLFVVAGLIVALGGGPSSVRWSVFGIAICLLAGVINVAIAYAPPATSLVASRCGVGRCLPIVPTSLRPSPPMPDGSHRPTAGATRPIRPNFLSAISPFFNVIAISRAVPRPQPGPQYVVN